MRNLLITLTFILAGCASTTPKNDALDMRVWSYVPGPTRSQYVRLAPAEAREVTYLGLQKLPLEDLYRFNYLQLVIMEASSENCNAVINNSTMSVTEEKDVGLDVLTDQEYDEYAKILAKMISLGTDYNLRTYPTPTKEQFNEALKIVMNDDTVKFSPMNPRQMRRGVSNSQELCWTYQKVANYANEKRDETSEKLIRYLSLNYINFKRFAAPFGN